MSTAANHPTCSTCDHFTPPREDEYEIAAFRGKGVCKKTAHTADVAQWDEDYTRDELKPEYRDDTAFVADGSGYSANLIPSPNHYCPMHTSLPGKAGAA